MKIQDKGENDMKFTFKVSDFHINVSGTQRQKVKTAAQLFSRTVSKAMEYYGFNNKFKLLNWKEVLNSKKVNLKLL